MLFCILAVESISSLHVLKLNSTADIASAKLIYRNTVSTSASINLTNTLLRTTVSIRQVVAWLNATTHHLKVRNLTDMWLHTSLEEIQRLRTVRIRSNLFATSVVQLRHLANERNYITQEFHQAAYTHILACANAEYWEYRACNQTLADTLAKFIFGKSFLFEEFLHQSLIVLGSSLNESLVELHGFVHFFCRDILNGRSATLRLP